MKFFIVLSFAAVALSMPLEDTPEVKEAKATFKAAFDMAEEGKHADLAPKMEFIPDTEEVMKAREEFMQSFEQAEKGEHAQLAPEAPVANLYAHHYPYVTPYYHAAYVNHPYYNNLVHHNNFVYPYYNWVPFATVPQMKVEKEEDTSVETA